MNKSTLIEFLFDNFNYSEIQKLYRLRDRDFFYMFLQVEKGLKYNICIEISIAHESEFDAFIETYYPINFKRGRCIMTKGKG